MHFYLVTTYNHQPFIAQAIESIVHQYRDHAEFARRAEIFVVDDASLDGTPAELERLAKLHHNIRLHFNSQNQGIGKNRNFLLDWLYGQVVTAEDHVIFLDGDDMLAKQHLHHKLRLFTRDPDLEVVGGQLQLFYMDGRPDSVVNTFSLDPEIQEIASLFECHFYASNAMFRASVFKRPQVRFPETETSEDWLFFAIHPLRKRHAEDVTVHYRRHTHNLTDTVVDPLTIGQLRHTAHRLWALRIGLHLSDEECHLLDLVGYLSFRLRMSAQTIAKANIYMPWFKELKNQPYTLSHWADTRKALRTLFQRLLDNNARIPYYNPIKLKTFLEGTLKLADQEVMEASTIQVGASARQPA